MALLKTETERTVCIASIRCLPRYPSSNLWTIISNLISETSCILKMFVPNYRRCILARHTNKKSVSHESRKQYQVLPYHNQCQAIKVHLNMGKPNEVKSGIITCLGHNEDNELRSSIRLFDTSCILSNSFTSYCFFWFNEDSNLSKNLKFKTDEYINIQSANNLCLQNPF